MITSPDAPALTRNQPSGSIFAPVKTRISASP